VTKDPEAVWIWVCEDRGILEGILEKEMAMAREREGGWGDPQGGRTGFVG
jgi:hypothetical protein